MEIILSSEITEAIHKLGDLIKCDHRFTSIQKLADDYTADEKLGKLLDEYNALQSALSVEYSKEEVDEKATKPLRERMDEIFAEVSAIPAYVAYKEASEDYEEFTNAVFEELEFSITGHRHDESCTHDCSTCGGCH